MGISKIYELAEHCDEDELKLLVEGKAIDAVGSVDDVDRMSVRELKDALRKVRKPSKRLADLKEQNRELQSELDAYKRGQAGLAPDVTLAERQCRKFSDGIDEAFRELSRITLPEDPADRGRVIAKMLGVLTEGQSRFQNIADGLVEAAD